MNILLEKQKISELHNEKKLIVLLSRTTFSEDIINEINEILQDNYFNWFEFYQYALYHKVITLCWKNINKLFPDTFQPKYAREIIHAAYLSLIERNRLYQAEINKIIEAMSSLTINVIPVKGAYLIPNIYKDYGVRYSGDADFLIKYDDLGKAEKVLEEKGYVKGIYNSKERSITKISRREDIKWKTFMSNSHPFLKLSNSELLPVYKADFRFAFDDSLNKQPVNEIVDAYNTSGSVKAAHYLIHLCTHFYDEAKHTVDIALSKDMNIIKLCDIREYIMQATTNNDLKELVCFAKKHGFEQQVYFTMLFLAVIYNDGYEEEVLADLGIENESFIYTFGDNTFDNRQKYDLSIADRLFACGKMKDFINSPKLFL